MKVKEAMKKDVLMVKRATSLRGLLDMFKDFHTLPLIPVVNKDNILIGVVNSESLLDILRPQQSRLFRNIPFVEVDENVFDLDTSPLMGELIIVDDVMDRNIVSVREDDPLDKAYKQMRLYKKNRLPVVDASGKLLGIIGVFDIIWRMFKEKDIV
ncbi:MAG: CBS domain-containing protein [Candidatus Omnitrophica bacterium]|nr:CBS domain-containing protein [Candidatus Omnitrophota bacterium]